MKKAYICLISFFSLAAVFTACYYFSYRSALKHFNNKAKVQGENLALTLEKNLTSPEAVKADTSKVDIVKPATEYILEIMDVPSGRLLSNIINPPDYLIGLTREEVLLYLDNYMKEVPLEEFQKGLISYELISFSSQKLVLRKSYNESLITNKYLIVVENGEVVVYYSDRKTVFEYTKIPFSTLPEEEQIKLSNGIEVKDQEELFSILENYTS